MSRTQVHHLPSTHAAEALTVWCVHGRLALGRKRSSCLRASVPLKHSVVSTGRLGRWARTPCQGQECAQSHVLQPGPRPPPERCSPLCGCCRGRASGARAPGGAAAGVGREGVDTLLRAAQCYGSTPPASRVGIDAVGAERAAQALQRVSSESVLFEPGGCPAVAREPRPSTALTTTSQDSLKPCVSQNSTSASVFPVVPRPKASAVFATHSERRRATALFQASRLMQALPPQAEQWLLGDTNQVPAKARLKLVQAFMLKHGGPEGQNAAKAFRSWNLLTAYARANLRYP